MQGVPKKLQTTRPTGRPIRPDEFIPMPLVAMIEDFPPAEREGISRAGTTYQVHGPANAKVVGDPTVK